MGGANEGSRLILGIETTGKPTNGKSHRAEPTNGRSRRAKWAAPGGCHSPRLEQHGRPLGLQVIPPEQLQLGLLGPQGLQLPQQRQAAQVSLGGAAQRGAYGVSLWSEPMG